MLIEDINPEIQDSIARAMSDQVKLLQNKKEQFIKDMFLKKGFSDVVETIGYRFPKIVAIRHGDWDYYYADNGTKSGVFVVAIKNEYDFSEAGGKDDKFKYVMSISFKWHEAEPMFLKILNK